MIVGREHERARIHGLLDDARRGRTGALLLVGEPGIGKTALLDDACTEAGQMLVLGTTGVEPESLVPFAGLDAVLRPILRFLDRLDVPQKEALETALALRGGDEPSLLAVGAGTLRLLAEAAAEQPILVAIDDVHWLDQPSANALAFAARRLHGEDIAFLVTMRVDAETPLDTGMPRLRLGPLTRADSRRLLETRGDEVPARSVEQLLDVAEGNPLALLELPASISALVPGTSSPPDRVQRAFAARLAQLPNEARLVLAAAAAEPDFAIVRRAVDELGADASAIGVAEASGLVRWERDGVRFRHPLVRSLAYASLPPAAQREVHRALASATDRRSAPDRYAWHVAAAATEPDEELAALLEETADRAQARGGHGAAAEALERAAELSTLPDARARRLTVAARSWYWAGDSARALGLAEAALAAASDSQAKADALLEIAGIHLSQGVAYDEDRFVETVLGLRDLDPDRMTRLLIHAVNWRAQALDADGAVERADALERAARSAGSWWRPRGIATAAAAHICVGDTEGFWNRLQEVLPDDAAIANMALDLVWVERYGEARHALQTTLREARGSGNVMRVIWNQAASAHLELRLGKLEEARLAAAEAIVLADMHGTSLWACIAESALAAVDAWQGAEECVRLARHAIETAQEAGSATEELSARTSLGIFLSGAGRWDDVVAELARSEERWRKSSTREPSAAAFVPDLVEALGRLGEPGRAHVVLDCFRAAAERSQRRWALAAAARCDGVLAAADAFVDPFEQALTLLDGWPTRLERARTQLAYGERLRRAGQRREARPHLRAAFDAFAAVSATPWADRAAAELEATGETTGPRSVDRRARLTPQELQIARLVGEGMTNKQIASQLYLSPKTIEYHLGNTYRKLDVHSRAELTRLLADAGSGRP